MSVSFAHRATLGLTGCLLVSAAFADNPLPESEPGLWEITMSQNSAMDAVMQGMQETLQQMPEAQRKQMEQMMAESGVNLTQPNVVRECITPEMAKRGFEPVVEDVDMTCSDAEWSRSRNQSHYVMTCTGPDGEWTVRGRIWDATSKRYKSEMTLEGSAEGQPVSMDMTHEARWLGADCGAVQPRP